MISANQIVWPAGRRSTKRFGKHPASRVHRVAPLNSGPAPSLLIEQAMTHAELFFVRNHGNVPAVDAASYRLCVAGLVGRDLALSLHDLRSRFPRVTRTASLQCAGLRRKELNAVRAIPNEVNWGEEPIGTAVWGGVRLRDVLAAAQIQTEAKHVSFTGLDQVERNGRKFGFGGSVPIEKAQGDEVLLALEMNGRPLDAVHGYPLRVVVPGYIGARSVKWLGEIRAEREPSDNYFQTRAYKLFPPSVTAETADWESAPAITEMPTNSAICAPQEGDRLTAGEVTVRGYALAQGDRAVESVEVILDDGSRVTAQFLSPSVPWTWRLWEATVRLTPGAHEIAVVATDSSGYTQPASLASIWNLKGYLNNAWHRIKVHVR